MSDAKAPAARWFWRVAWLGIGANPDRCRLVAWIPVASRLAGAVSRPVPMEGGR